ncbi:MAG: peptidoglycan-binding protein [Bradyrhizobium sp.]|uniref:peptidoglycan-binding domain-containing protein n=1 Tax=Bradyrhizobium sp. TaxID=376 RepID=UPI0025BF73D1|nr:peptidoglycan-binding domain-containing protein [Bradyrhizobium sp.]MBI5262536.1 peptidoglycan-binding protein [Bradyrhizobium sp.]
MPRLSARDDDMPSRRRGAKAVALDTETERNLAMRILLHSPKDALATLLALAAISAVIFNALFLQAGRHPAPIFGTVLALPAAPVLVPANPLPRPRPAEAGALPLEPRAMEYRPAEPRAAEKPAEVRSSADPLTNLVKATAGTTSASSANVARPPAPIPQASGSRRVAAVQRALTEYGYGQLKPTGTIGADTQAAIGKFEREHKMPVTGQVSERLVRELAAATGRAIE